MRFNESKRRRSVLMMGDPVIVHNWSWDGATDDYGDPAPNSWTERTEETRVIQYESQRAEQMGGAEGPNIEETVRMFIPDDIEVHIASDSDAERATVLEFKDDGREYKVYSHRPGYKGINNLLCRRDE